MQNSSDNAARFRAYKNEKADLPKYSVGDKVLLYDPTIRKNENPKLKIRWIGPYLITEVAPNFTFKLQHWTTGLDVKRPLHARRNC